jgi:hypothetical protein
VDSRGSLSDTSTIAKALQHLKQFLPLLGAQMKRYKQWHSPDWLLTTILKNKKTWQQCSAYSVSLCAVISAQ